MSELAGNAKPFESVWDYPRPPRLEAVEWRIRVVHAGVTIVDAPRAIRVLETSQPPAYYVAPEFVDRPLLVASVARATLCEWKGVAEYADVVIPAHGDTTPVVVPAAAWTYADPDRGFSPLAGHWAFYAQKLDGCWIDDERVASNEGSFYGGWVTINVTGPFKGAPGSSHW